MISYNGLFNLTWVSTIGDSAICLPWKKIFVWTPLEQIVGLRRVTEDLLKLTIKRVWKYLSMSLLHGTDTGLTLIKWDNTMKPFILPKHLLLLLR